MCVLHARETYACRMQSSSFTLSEPIPVPETAEDALLSLMMAMGRRLRQRQPGDVIDYSAFPILKLLTHQGPMRLSNVAGVLGLDASTVSRHVRQLEERGLLERTGDPDDGRASRVAVSEHGSTCLAQGFDTRRHLITNALDGFTEADRESLRGLLHRLVENLMTQHDQQEADVAPQTQETSS
jgi:DNA-binding MarR family transcriptional regulator